MTYWTHRCIWRRCLFSLQRWWWGRRKFPLQNFDFRRKSRGQATISRKFFTSNKMHEDQFLSYLLPIFKGLFPQEMLSSPLKVLKRNPWRYWSVIDWSIQMNRLDLKPTYYNGRKRPMSGCRLLYGGLSLVTNIGMSLHHKGWRLTPSEAATILCGRAAPRALNEFWNEKVIYLTYAQFVLGDIRIRYV